MKKILFFIFLVSLFFPIIVESKAPIIAAKGIVISAPGEFGKQFFYITDGKNLWQIYSYRSNFPKIKKGDIVEVRGEKSESRGLTRLKISDQKQIKITGNQNLPVAGSIEIDQAQKNLGKLIIMTGELKKEDSEKFILRDQKGEIILISPKQSSSFFVEQKNIKISGVPIMNGKQLSLLVISSTSLKDNKKNEEKTEIASDMARPENEFRLAKTTLLVLAVLLFLVSLTKIAKKRKLF